ncbi:MAG: preprotein translocase subunit SecE [Amoebophilaceae bacterium]|jgi:preprotein translocase subunit SecE|nr:preprotein translocase subunit SecE [Amoebophilaceae bacterium]
MSKIKTFVLGSIDEMRHKVVWPVYDELQRSSVLVLAASFTFAVVIGCIDLIFKNAISWLYSAF